ncbi:MAG TPA: hypothetical protein VHK69_19610, partial [Chitinophagaceae bacterium]|nr:hypothetical protein [Chitinophagaceae bacterium]
MRMPYGFLLLLSFPFFFSHCYRMRASHGGGEIKAIPARTVNAADISLAPGYRIEPVAQGLTFPTAAAFDAEGRLYVTESGYAYGEVWTEPRLLRINSGGTPAVIARGEKNGPWTGVTWHDGFFYVTEGGVLEGGRILKISPEGTITVLARDLPSYGDHHTNGPVVRDGFVYFGQGTATNAGVVGPDNAEYGWLPRKRDFHDIPCGDVTLAGVNYTEPDVLTPDPSDQATTGAFVPFGTATAPGQVIPGKVPCTGAILRVPVTGGKVEVVAWGLRNPFGLALSPEGRLFATENAFDDRGSRGIWGAGDVLWEIKPDLWYGFPDYSAGKPVRQDEEFKVPERKPVLALLQKLPNTPPQPSAVFGVHASANGLDFSRNNSFGFTGEAFVAEFGDMAPKVGKVLSPVGFRIVRVDVNTGIIRDFAV